MFLYTIVPLEYIFEENEDEVEQKSEKNKDFVIKRGSTSLLVSSLEGGQTRVSRIISTDPQDFLNPAWQPGAILPES